MLRPNTNVPTDANTDANTRNTDANTDKSRDGGEGGCGAVSGPTGRLEQPLEPAAVRSRPAPRYQPQMQFTNT